MSACIWSPRTYKRRSEHWLTYRCLSSLNKSEAATWRNQESGGDSLLAERNGRNAVASSTVRPRMSGSCLKLTNEYMTVIFYRPHAGGLLRVTWSGIYCWMFLKAGKTQQFPFHSWNHACSAWPQGPLSPPVSVSWNTISKGNSHLCRLRH